MNKLERDFIAQPRRTLPPEWREEILANAVGSDAAVGHSTIPWLVPRWLRYGVAAAWILSLALHLMTPNMNHGKPLNPTTSNTSPDHPAKWALAIQNYHDDHLIN